ncbi:MAG: ATP-binding protein [Acidimicrobiia bacterium]|nr:MAG: ATP-binding protein [Acidimicrobiia bacterium]
MVHLYSGSSIDFVREASHGRIASTLEERFVERFRYKPPQTEVRAWQNSLSRTATVLRETDLSDNGVIVELQLPLSSRRLDCMITGRDAGGSRSAVVIELKQWDQVEPSPVDGCVVAWTGKGLRDVLHPSEQAAGYQRYLLDTHTAFADGSIRLEACAWLHNLPSVRAAPLFEKKHADRVALNPSFTSDSVVELESFLDVNLSGGGGMDVLETVIRGRYRPHKRLLDHVARTIAAEPTYILLDEQKVAFNHILTHVRSHHLNNARTVFLVRGGPGTGKSVIALNLVGELARQGYTVNHATGSKAFTETLRKTVGKRAGAVFSYYRNYSTAEPDALDVLVLDEAHRIRVTSDNRFTKKEARADRPQVDELVGAARTTVFFIDDLQVVRPGEVGSSTLIRDAARRAGATLIEHELETQFRCGGSDHYVSWVANLLELERTPDVLWDPAEEFDFEVVDTPHELEQLVRMRSSDGFTARLAAGFCWPWSDPNPDGTLVADVRIGDWSMPWNAKPDAGRLAPGVPKSNNWATEPGGVDQVGCVYTAQGFEYDYAGVIVGPDLVWRAREGWIGRPEYSKDGAVTRRLKSSDFSFTDLAKHTYRVLLTRGLMGCYVYFVDEQTRDFVLSRIVRS